ncbi:hypothetical protein ABB37_03740 [Leptomonas pyrrhocoris]|uniref:Uncharacterized protein n=1 Tax=Leptomonas pyrrhocoris TaxID=157538 RepID=A0A0M9G325_LEPPY|nr:hypothetical protein ABB37_03740 [Leptomonas pyrrhocoris]KPA81355.1 hypothetical protein ABB37_03740 [Leptomonas pyrrhocoris]|eukprot:XP_015659794.1 hypothetical protein ABB37_03740 [Leptomonas pyrrhocoris]
MTDPFLENDGSNLLEKEMRQLRLENRELRLTNTNLRARLALATPTASVDGDARGARIVGAGAGRAMTNSEADQHGEEEEKPCESAAIRSSADRTTAPLPQSRRTRGIPSSNATDSSAQVTAARVQEAVQQAKKELQGELDKQHKAAALEKAQKEQLKREFELFVSTTCEREAAYQLVYTQLYREMEAQKELVRSAQAQLEEQRLQSVEMRKSMEAAIATAASKGNSGGGGPAVAPPTASSSAAAVESVGDDSMVPSAKRQRTTKEPVNAPPTRQQIKRLPKDLNWFDLAGGTPAAPSDDVAMQKAETDSAGPRQLKIIAGGASLRNAHKVQKMKRTRDTVSETCGPGSAPSARGSARNAPTGLHVPVAPVFASASAAAAVDGNSSITVGSRSVNKHLDTRAPSAAIAPSPSSPSSSFAHGPASAAVEALWRLLPQHTEATQGFLPLWQHLVVLRGTDRHSVLQVLVSLLVHLLSPDVVVGPASPTTRRSQPPSFASLPNSFTSQATSITVVATAIRLIAVQLEDAAQQQRDTAAAQPQTKMLLSSLFYRVCVATLCRWQAVDSAWEVLEHWAMAIHHLYGFQPALLQLMHYTNTTTAYHRTRLGHSWIVYTAQCIFSQCCTAAASSAMPVETAVARWRELCDSLGWSAHAQTLERLETAAARCVAMTRVGSGPFTPSCAEEALLSLRLVVLYKGFDHMEQIAKLLEQPGVLPMALTKEIYAELVSLAVRDRVPFRTQDALHHALRLLREYLLEVAPERCTSAEHFVSAPRRSHVLAALALLRVDATEETEASSRSSASVVGTQGYAATAASEVRESGRKAALQWLQAQTVALEVVRQSRSLAPDRPLLLRDTPLGRFLLSEADAD